MVVFGAWGNALIVRGEMKEKLAAAGLKHLAFRKLDTETGEWPPDIQPLYLLWSDFELPPVQNLLFDNKVRVFPSEGNWGPHPDGCFLLDSYEMSPRPRYNRAHVDPSAFDVALTYERFGNHEPCWPALIVSQTFRAVCKKLGIKLTWWPVILE